MIKHHRHKAQIAQSKCGCLTTLCAPNHVPFCHLSPNLSLPHTNFIIFSFSWKRDRPCVYSGKDSNFLSEVSHSWDSAWRPLKPILTPPSPHGGVCGGGGTMNKRLRHLVHCEHLFISTILLQLVTEPAVPQNHTAKLNSQFVDRRHQYSP